MARKVRVAQFGQPTWAKLHFLKVAADEKAVDRAAKADEYIGVEATAEFFKSRLSGGGGGGGGDFCFASLLDDLPEFDDSASRTRREQIEAAETLYAERRAEEDRRRKQEARKYRR